MHVVIGAGIAGLAVARRLHDAGHEVVVLEAGDRIGGMAASIEVGGAPVDLGSHRLHPATPEHLLDDLGRRVVLQRRPRRGRIRVAGRWLGFPLSPAGLLRGLPPALAARAAVDAATGPLRSPDDDTYADVLRAGLGPAVWHAFHEPYAWKLWGTDPRRLSGELARRRVSASTPLDVAQRLVRVRRPHFLYPADGFGAIARALADGLDVRTGRRVVRLVAQDDRVVVGVRDGRVVSARHVFSTLPAATTAALLGADAEGAVPVRAMVLVYLVVPGRPYTRFDAHYFPERQVLPSRVSEPFNYRERGADPGDRTVLCAEIPCWPGDDVWAAPADALATRVRDDLIRSGLPDPRAVDVHVERLASVYPVLTPPALAALGRAERAVERVGRVTVLGRQGLATPDNTHHVLDMGHEAAACVRDDGTFDDARWRRARERFRSFVVED